MNMNRPDMTEDVKSKNYTNKSLQRDSTPNIKGGGPRTQPLKSPAGPPPTNKTGLEGEESGPNGGHPPALCSQTAQPPPRVPCPAATPGGSIRVPKDSFDAWLNRAA